MFTGRPRQAERPCFSLYTELDGTKTASIVSLTLRQKVYSVQHLRNKQIISFIPEELSPPSQNTGYTCKTQQYRPATVEGGQCLVQNAPGSQAAQIITVKRTLGVSKLDYS